MARQPRNTRPGNFDYMHLPHPIHPTNSNPGPTLQPHEMEASSLWAGLGSNNEAPSLNNCLNPFAHNANGPEDVDSHGSAHDTRGPSIEMQPHAAQRMAPPDFLVSQFEVHVPGNYSPYTGVVASTPRYALPMGAPYGAAVNHFDPTWHPAENSNPVGFQGSRETSVGLSSEADGDRMQGIISPALPDSPPSWVSQAGSSVSNEVETDHPLNKRTYQAPINRDDGAATLHTDQQGNARHSRGGAAGAARKVKRHVVGSRRVVAARKLRRKDKSQQGRFLCEECQADFTTNYNLSNHMKSHYGIKDNHCEGCGKPFGARCSLVRHRRGCKALVTA